MSKLICEYLTCKRHATQADTYINAWLCTTHYSYIGRLTGDYQNETIDFDMLDGLVGV